VSANRSIVWGVLAAAALAAGCAQPHCYTSAATPALASEQAGLILAGEVVEVKVGRHWPQGKVCGPDGAVLGTDCVAEEIVTFRVDRIVKGSPDLAGPVAFRYLGPCFHPVKGAKVERPAPPILRGDRLMAYLVKQGGQWWLIAHQMETSETGAGAPARRVRLYTGD